MEKKDIIIIAEAGVNHNGNMDIAENMIKQAKKCGANIIKFQTAKVESLVTRYAEKANYQKKNSNILESQRQMLERILFSFDKFERLKYVCDQEKIQFLSTPFDIESIEFLNDFDMPFWKIPSGEITNYPYLVKIAQTHKPVVLSTGMCEMEEVKNAWNILKYNGSEEIKLLQCNTEYPTPYKDVNLRSMNMLKDTFKCDIGYSDHTLGIEVSIAAVALGATIIEKHFTLDRESEGPDHKASIEPNEFKNMVQAIRHVEQALGDGIKRRTESEKINVQTARKSIVALRNIEKGETYSENNITTKRPGGGICPMQWNELIGKTAKRNFMQDEFIEV